MIRPHQWISMVSGSMVDRGIAAWYSNDFRFPRNKKIHRYNPVLKYSGKIAKVIL